MSKSFKDRCREANERADIVSVATALGLDVDTRGRIPFAHCPFHGDEGRKNLAFYQEAGDRGALVPRCYCYTCRQMWTALDLACHQLRVELPEALDWLERLLGIRQGEAQRIPYTPRVSKPPPPKRDRRAAIDHSIRRLWSNEGKRARDYLLGRGISEETLREYQLGYWRDDGSGWTGRFTIPYLESLEPASPVWTMVGGKVRDAEYVDGGADDSPKYLYTSSAIREPYLWRVGMARGQDDGTLILCEGELDGLSLLSALGNTAPVVALGGIGTISTVANDPRIAGLDILYIADAEAEPRWGTDHEERDVKKLERIERAVGESVWKLKQLNANVRLVYPPGINGSGKTDINDILIAYGPEYLQDWVLEEIAGLSSSYEARSLL